MSETLSLDRLRSCLLDLSQPISKRTHAAFHLRTIGSVDAMQIISAALLQRQDSALMRHELAYILGQMKKVDACEILTSVLVDETDDVLVRHESAEALGAIGQESSLPVLMEYVSHSAPEIAETCQIAIDLIKWRVKQKVEEETKQGNEEDRNIYLSVDPAPPFAESKTVDELISDLLDESQSLFWRYRAMFSLRNKNSDEAALALVQGFRDSSALFRHEVAYVLGQVQRPVTVPGLAAVLRDENEHRMVRHEAAEALGAIGGQEVESILVEFQDNPDIVGESCNVALDTIDYWSEFKLG